MSEFTKPLEDLSKNATEYVDMKIDELKLKTVKGLSVAMNELVAVLLILFVSTIVILSAAFGAILLIGDLVGSYAVGAFIVSAVFLAILVILYSVRKKLFINSFLKLFLEQFFNEDDIIR